jgi:hypothetical protein
MSRLDELKKQYPELNITLMDVLKKLDTSKSYKYMALICKIFSERFDLEKNYNQEDYNYRIVEIQDGLKSKGIDIKDIKINEQYVYWALSDYFPQNTFSIFLEFMYLMERGLIENKDVTSYKSIDDMRGAVTLASIREITKELEGQVIKEYEDEKWVAVRPLSFSASAKYGAGTRWCTTYHKEKNYFERYWRQGILVYFINKKTGYKFAGYRDLSNKELSFWNAEDTRIDYLDVDVDDYLFQTIVKIFKSTESNKNLCNPDLQEQVHEECIEQYEKLENSVQPIDEPVYVSDITPQPVYEIPTMSV